MLNRNDFEGYSKDDDVSKIYIYEPALKSLFDDYCLNKTVNVADKLLTALQDSHQDVFVVIMCYVKMAGEIFCWKLLIAQLNLTGVPFRHYRKK